MQSSHKMLIQRSRSHKIIIKLEFDLDDTVFNCIRMSTKSLSLLDFLSNFSVYNSKILPVSRIKFYPLSKIR